jgi:hypothetical protein
VIENIKGTQDVSLETRRTFQNGSGSEGYPQLPDKTAITREPFPMYVEPSIKGMGLGF